MRGGGGEIRGGDKRAIVVWLGRSIIFNTGGTGGHRVGREEVPAGEEENCARLCRLLESVLQESKACQRF
jgi:hypothetical protein